MVLNMFPIKFLAIRASWSSRQIILSYINLWQKYTICKKYKDKTRPRLICSQSVARLQRLDPTLFAVLTPVSNKMRNSCIKIITWKLNFLYENGFKKFIKMLFQSYSKLNIFYIEELLQSI